MNNFKPYGNNILIAPQSKDKVIGDTSKYYLYGKVLDVGETVGTWRFLFWRLKKKNAIAKGDTICFTLWGLNEFVSDKGAKHYFIQDNPDFVLGVIKHAN